MSDCHRSTHAIDLPQKNQPGTAAHAPDTLPACCNTAIVNGYNALFGSKQKLGSWPNYLVMRETVMQVNTEYRSVLSKDLGAFAGLLLELGSGRLIIGDNADAALKGVQEKAEQLARKRHQQVVDEQREESKHTQVQPMLLRIGRALNYQVYVARNDRHRACDGESFALLATSALPDIGAHADVMNTVGLIDVLWPMAARSSAPSKSKRARRFIPGCCV